MFIYFFISKAFILYSGNFFIFLLRIFSYCFGRLFDENVFHRVSLKSITGLKKSEVKNQLTKLTLYIRFAKGERVLHHKLYTSYQNKIKIYNYQNLITHKKGKPAFRQPLMPFLFCFWRQNMCLAMCCFYIQNKTAVASLPTQRCMLMR